MFYNQSVDDVLTSLKTDKTGLQEKEAESRLKKYGLNEIQKKAEIHPFVIFLNQFKSFIVYILIAAVIISLFLQEYIDAGVIFAILLLNALFGFIQEYKAEKSIEALKKLAAPKAKVIRNQKTEEVDAAVLVPGDIVLIEVGDKVPADARIIEISNLQTQESALTGESLPIKKEIDMLPGSTHVADRKNMVFAGTIVTDGHAKAAVTGTGMKTEIGKIAKLIQETEQELTPLQRKL
ncbi:MAG: HAD-IC family P-type ATPase, partial [Nanoarchaeota archaeon]|nr:HAD-IC family P-type ATPase [Nanoarchaeota archaeon]